MTAELSTQADAALSAGRIDDAIALLNQVASTAPDDFDNWMKLAALKRLSGDQRGALDAVNLALGIAPNAFLALLLKGSLHERLNEPLRAAEVYRAALHFAEEGVTPPRPVAAQLEHARKFLADLRLRVEAELIAQSDMDQRHRDRAIRFLDNTMERRAAYHQEPTHYRYPGLPDIEFFDHHYAALRMRLQAAFPAIRSEFLSLMANHAQAQEPYVNFAPGQPLGQWAELNRSPDWNVFHLIRYGEPHAGNAAACPQTIAAFAGDHQVDAPGITPNLMFSLLAPHTRIPPHHGVANFRAVLHLPIIVPDGCFFRVGADTRQWVEGEPWVFDDTIEHEAWNDSDELRVVLIGDLWRPELDETDRATIRHFIGAQEITDSLGAL